MALSKKNLSSLQNPVLNQVCPTWPLPLPTRHFHLTPKIGVLNQPKPMIAWSLSLSLSDFLKLEKPFSNLDLSLEHSDTLEVLGPYCPYFSQPVLVLGSAFSETWFLHIEFLHSIQAKFHLGLAQSQLHPTILHPLKPLTKVSSCQMSCFSS